MKDWNWKIILPGWLFFTALTLLCMYHGFFWDTVQLGSKHAHFFFDTHFSSFTLPNEIDSGHPPTFGLYLAVLWKIFGRTLPVSHLAMLPFLLGIVIQVYLLTRRFVNEKQLPWVMLILLAEPTLLAQSTLMSPDIVLIFFYLLALNSVLSKNRTLLALSLTGLGLISLRGIMAVVAIFIIDLIFNRGKREEKKTGFFRDAFRQLPAYLPVAVLVSAWLAWHFAETGWIGYHEDSPWAGSFEKVGIAGMVRNLALIGWRFLDFGRVVLWITAFGFLVLAWKKKIKLREDIQKLTGLFLVPLLCFLPSMVTHSHLTGHRYLLIPIFFFAFLVCITLSEFRDTLRKKLLFVMILFGLATGHLWRYPEGVAMGWDATLGHLPYYSLRLQMMDYMREENIPFDQTESSFPNLATPREIDLSEDFTHFEEKFTAQRNYVFYSNVYNGFSDVEIEGLKEHYTLIKEFSSYPVRVALYRKNIPFIHFQF